MKSYMYIIFAALILSVSSCDKDFEEVNTNPLGITSIDPNFQLANAQYSSVLSTYNYEAEIVQQIITPFGGVLAGGNHNVIASSLNSKWNSLYNGPVKNLVDVIRRVEGDETRTNLYNMARIMKAYDFMLLVDAYGDLPYTEAGLGFYEDNFLPKYDTQEAIYTDLLAEVEDATNKLDASKPSVNEDLFYKGNISQWKKFGNSLLLRLGMRYSKLDPAKAEQIAKKAVDPARGGVMSSNDDNAIIDLNE